MTLFKKFVRYQNRIALISKKTGNITYKKLNEILNNLKSNIPERSLILLISENSVASIISYIFSIKNNSAIIIVDIKTSEIDTLKLIQKYQPSYLIIPKNYSKKFFKKQYEYLNDLYDVTIFKTKNKKKILLHKDLNVLLPTSGSMGTPKLVKLSKKNLKSNTDSIIKYLKIKKVDRSITNMPFSYIYTISIINTYLESGASIYVTSNSVVSKEFWNEFKKNKITSLNGVPYIYEILIKLGLEKIHSKYLKTLTQAGGKLKNELLEKIIIFCKKKKINFYSMYGQTEASPRMTYLDWKYCEKKLGSIGKPIANSKIWLEDNNKREIKNSFITGELIYKGKNVCLGYSYKSSDLSKGDENKGILRTGDLGYFDKQGFLYITGRKSRLIKIFGTRYNLDELESKMKKMRFDIVCKELSSNLCIFYEKNYKKKIVLENLSKITNQHITAFNCFKIEKFPRSANGKIQYSKLNVNA